MCLFLPLHSGAESDLFVGPKCRWSKYSNILQSQVAELCLWGQSGPPGCHSSIPALCTPCSQFRCQPSLLSMSTHRPKSRIAGNQQRQQEVRGTNSQRPQTFASFLPCPFFLLLHKKLVSLLIIFHSPKQALCPDLTHTLLFAMLSFMVNSLCQFVALKPVPFCGYKLTFYLFPCCAVDAKLEAMPRLCILQWKCWWIEAD